jgi:hypothetical protein
MQKRTIVAAFAAGFYLAVSSSAAAQTQTTPTKYFVDVNGGAQTQSRSIDTSTSFPLYNETAVINTAQGIDGGGLFDFSVGYRLPTSLVSFGPGAFGVGVGVSTFSDKGNSSVAASIPSPIAFNKAETVTTSASDLKHKEVATHILFSYFYTVRDKIEVALSVGPSFFNVSQDFTTATVPTGTQSLSLGTVRERTTAVGANFGFNANYFVRPNYGAGIFLRYAGATADFDTFSGLKVGGFQIGGGLRLRF